MVIEIIINNNKYILFWFCLLYVCPTERHCILLYSCVVTIKGVEEYHYNNWDWVANSQYKGFVMHFVIKPWKCILHLISQISPQASEWGHVKNYTPYGHIYTNNAPPTHILVTQQASHIKHRKSMCSFSLLTCTQLVLVLYSVQVLKYSTSWAHSQWCALIMHCQSTEALSCGNCLLDLGS